jgi:hypothetical protein
MLGSFFRAHYFSLLVLGLSIFLVGAIATRERHLLGSGPSNRYRLHAIPVALSQLYHGRQHDYTAYRSLALTFQRMDRSTDELITEFANPLAPVGDETYFWAADDRGLSDVVFCAFRLFGPRVGSLGRFYVLLLSLSVLTFVVGYWRSPSSLLLVPSFLLGLLVLSQACSLREQLPLADGQPWVESLALSESRLFEALGLLAALHLGLLAWHQERLPLLTWLTALPQALFLLFLYHARSSLGWIYLALFAVAAARILSIVWPLVRGRKGTWALTRPPILVTLLLIGCLLTLSEYKRLSYHPAYFAEQGPRTVWHNALMGFGYHPRLRDTLPVRIRDDAAVVRLLIARLHDRHDVRLDPSWTQDQILCSLGGCGTFNWSVYEQVAREMYLDVWQKYPGEAAACYLWYKPADVAGQTAHLGRLLLRDMICGKDPLLVAGMLGTAALLALFLAAAWRSPADRKSLASIHTVCLILLGFSTIPGVAFYAAVPTLAGFYLSLTVATVLWLLRLLLRFSPLCLRSPNVSRTEPSPNSSTAKAA